MLALRSTSRLPNFSALFRDLRGAGANRRLSRLPNLLADLAGFGRGGDSSAFPNCGDLSAFDLTSGLCSLSHTCRPARLAGAWGTCKVHAVVGDYQPFRIVETCQPLTSQVDFAAFRIHADPQGSRAHGGLARLARSWVTINLSELWRLVRL